MAFPFRYGISFDSPLLLHSKLARLYDASFGLTRADDLTSVPGTLIIWLNNLVITKMQTSKSRNLIQKINQALVPYQAERIYLFGSLARGEADELSDVDLVIIKRTREPFWDRLREAARLVSGAIHRGADILVYTPEEFSDMLARGNAFAEMIVEEGRLIYDRQTQG
jgi:predicted nucleotidyltransferase